jgi:hypothetical protein
VKREKGNDTENDDNWCSGSNVDYGNTSVSHQVIIVSSSKGINICSNVKIRSKDSCVCLGAVTDVQGPTIGY